ncbi:MAG: hypothetical protein RIQ81_2326 [Pseudomonadota bacterium]|jgi:hypothetical protein
MMERLSLDPASWSKTEWTQTSGFLMALAAALNESGVVPQRHLDALRMDLSALQSGGGSARQVPPLLTLAKAGNEFLKLVEARYGRDRLILNLFRHSAKSWISETARVLARWGEQVTRNSDKVLNRILIIHRPGNEPADERLFSSLLVDFATRIRGCLDALDELYKRLDAMHGVPLDVPGQSGDEQGVAAKLSFSSLASDTELGREEEYFVRRVALEMANLAGAVAHFSSQLALNCDEAPAVLLELRNNWIKTEALRLFHFSWPGAESFVTAEVSRQQAMMSLASITNALLDLEAETSALMPGRISGSPNPATRQRAESVRGALIADAMVAGLDGDEAARAVVAMVSYAERHNLSSREMIVSELQKIHPALMPRTLQYFQSLTENDPVAGRKASEKSDSASRSRNLLNYFAEKSRSLSAMLALALTTITFLGGCGLKTATRSDVDDLRPGIPFRTNQK